LSACKLLAGAAVLSGLLTLPGMALALPAARDAVTAPPLPAQLIIFHHRQIESYCYPRNYWWFYRPYTTATEGYARCMPYFHYAPQAYDRRGYAPPK
jgi:hypothetical protein